MVIMRTVFHSPGYLSRGGGYTGYMNSILRAFGPSGIAAFIIALFGLFMSTGTALADQTIPLTGSGTNYSPAFEKVLYSWTVPTGALFTGMSGSISTNSNKASFNEALISVQELTSGTCPSQGEVFWDYNQLFARYPSSLGLAQNIVKNVAGGTATIPVNFTVPGGGIPISHCVYVILDGSILTGGIYTMTSNMVLHYTTDAAPATPVSIYGTGDESCFNMTAGCGTRYTNNTTYSFANYSSPFPEDTDILAFHGDISSSAMTADLVANFGFTPASGAWSTTDDFYVLNDCTNTPRGWQNAADWYSRLPVGATKIFSLTLQGNGMQTVQQPVDKDFTGVKIPKNGCVLHLVKESGAGGITTENQVSMFTRASAQQSPTSCTFNGQTIQSGGNVTAYKDSSVPYGSQCVSETRTCANGTLSGSYTNASCTVQGAASCTFNGQTIQSGSSVTAYREDNVPPGSQCTSETRTCTNGTLSGSYTKSSCSVGSYGAYCPQLSQNLKYGDRDALTVPSGQVSELQHFLAGYYSLNMGDIISGFFGSLTQSYVQRFQLAQGLPAFGFVGDLTRVRIAQVCGGGAVASKPTIASFAASPTSITSGQSATLSWNVTGASSTSISSIGTVTGTSIQVSPSQTTTYTLTATNPQGSVAAQATVAVSATTSSTVTLSATPPSGTAPLTTTLSWRPLVDSATGWGIFKLSFGDGQDNPSLVWATGSLAHTYQTPGTYTVTLKEALTGSGAVVASTLVTVNGTSTTPGMSCAFNGQTIPDGSSVTAYSNPGGTPQCVSEIRYCRNGVLSGSYQYATCVSGTCDGFSANCPVENKTCALDGVTIANGQSRTFYSVRSTTASDDTCSMHAQNRTCTNGTLSGNASYQYASCSICTIKFSFASCTPVDTGTAGGVCSFNASGGVDCTTGSVTKDNLSQLASVLTGLQSLLAKLKGTQ